MAMRARREKDSPSRGAAGPAEGLLRTRESGVSLKSEGGGSEEGVVWMMPTIPLPCGSI